MKRVEVWDNKDHNMLGSGRNMFRSKIKKKHKLLLGADGIILDVGTKAYLWSSWFGFNFSMEENDIQIR